MHGVASLTSASGSAKSTKDRHEDEDQKSKVAPRRKSTTISFLCDRDPGAPPAAASFVGTTPDECAYFFEVRSQAACGGAEPVEQLVGPGGVFGIIVLITVMVYFIGGCVYQRAVLHARGWRQLPNYSMWAGIGNFFKVSFAQPFFPAHNGPRPASETRGLYAREQRQSRARINYKQSLDKYFAERYFAKQD